MSPNYNYNETGGIKLKIFKIIANLSNKGQNLNFQNVFLVGIYFTIFTLFTTISPVLSLINSQNSIIRIVSTVFKFICFQGIQTQIGNTQKIIFLLVMLIIHAITCLTIFLYASWNRITNIALYVLIFYKYSIPILICLTSKLIIPNNPQHPSSTSTSQTQFNFSIVLFTLNILMLFSIHILNALIFHTRQLSPRNLLCTRFSFTDTFIQLAYFVGCVLAIGVIGQMGNTANTSDVYIDNIGEVSDQKQIGLFLYVTALLCLTCYQIYQQLVFYKWVDNRTTKISQIFQCIQLSVLISAFLLILQNWCNKNNDIANKINIIQSIAIQNTHIKITNNSQITALHPIKLIAQNIISLIISLSLFLSISINTFFNNRQQYYQLISPSELVYGKGNFDQNRNKKERDVILFMLAVNRVLRSGYNAKDDGHQKQINSSSDRNNNNYGNNNGDPINDKNNNNKSKPNNNTNGNIHLNKNKVIIKIIQTGCRQFLYPNQTKNYKKYKTNFTKHQQQIQHNQRQTEEEIDMIQFYDVKKLVLLTMDKLCHKYQQNDELMGIYRRLRSTVHQNFMTPHHILSRIKQSNINNMINQRISNAHHSSNSKQLSSSFLSQIETIKQSLSLHQQINVCFPLKFQLIPVEDSLLAEIKHQELQGKISKAVEAKVKFWGSLAKGSVMRDQLQLIQKQILQNMREIQSYRKLILSSFRESIKLVGLMIIYDRFVLLKDIMCPKLKQCVTKHRKNDTQPIYSCQSATPAKIMQSIYSDSCCTLQITMFPQNRFVLCSPSVQNVFGYSPASLTNQLLSTIIPQCLRQQHQKVINNWYRKCQKKKLGKVKQIYFVDRLGLLFDAILYLKVIYRIQKGQVNMIGTIVKCNQDDFVMLAKQKFNNQIKFNNQNKITKQITIKQKHTKQQTMEEYEDHSRSIVSIKTEPNLNSSQEIQNILIKQISMIKHKKFIEELTIIASGRKFQKILGRTIIGLPLKFLSRDKKILNYHTSLQSQNINNTNNNSFGIDQQMLMTKKTMRVSSSSMRNTCMIYHPKFYWELIEKFHRNQKEASNNALYLSMQQYLQKFQSQRQKIPQNGNYQLQYQIIPFKMGTIKITILKVISIIQKIKSVQGYQQTVLNGNQQQNGCLAYGSSYKNGGFDYINQNKGNKDDEDSGDDDDSDGLSSSFHSFDSPKITTQAYFPSTYNLIKQNKNNLKSQRNRQKSSSPQQKSITTQNKILKSLIKHGNKTLIFNKQMEQLLHHNNDLASSINSSTRSSDSSMISLQNNINTVQNIFNNKITIKDKNVIKSIIGIIVICVCALALCSFKIYHNYLAFGELRDIFFGDGACSDNLQLSMLIYSHALNIYNISHNIASVSTFPFPLSSFSSENMDNQTNSNNNNNSNSDINSLNLQQNIALQQQILHLSIQLQYLRNLITNEQLNMNNYITTLTNVRIYAYENDMVLWSQYQYNQSDDNNSNSNSNSNGSSNINSQRRVKIDINVTIMKFVLFYIDTVHDIVSIAEEIAQLSDSNIKILKDNNYVDNNNTENQNNNISSLQNSSQVSQKKISKLLTALSKQISQLHLNFPKLYDINYEYLQYFVKLFYLTKKVINLTGYIKLSITLFCVMIILMWFNCYFRTRQEEDYRIGNHLYAGHQCNVKAVRDYFKAVMELRLGFDDNGGDIVGYFGNSMQKIVQNSCNMLSIRQKTFEKSQKHVMKQAIQSKMTKLNKIREQLALLIQSSSPLHSHLHPNQSSHRSLMSINYNNNQQPKSSLSSHRTPPVQLIQTSQFPTLKLLSLCIFLAVLVINVVLQITENNIVNASQKMIVDINGLMNSENQLIGSYLKLKSQYIFVDDPIVNPSPPSQQQQQGSNVNFSKTQKLAHSAQFISLLQEILPIIDRTQIGFNSVAVDSLSLFTQYDASYSEKMITILTSNICQLLQDSLKDGGSLYVDIQGEANSISDKNAQQRKYFVGVQSDIIEKCRNDPQMKVINYGVVNGMTYFGIKLQQIIHQYLENINNSYSSPSSNSSLSQNQQIPINLPSIDKSLFLMLKIYQQTQAQITNSLTTALQNQNKAYISYIVLQQIIYFSIIVYLVAIFYKKQNERNCQFMGRILVVPLKIIKCNKNIVKFIDSFCDFQRFRIQQTEKQQDQNTKQKMGTL